MESKYQILPSLPLDKYEALRESIRENGIIEPVVVDEFGEIINGNHRVKICKELGIEYPTLVLCDLSEEQKQDLSLELNLTGRDLTKDQKKEVAISLFERGWTQERIALRMRINQSTVSRWLDNMQMHKPAQSSPKPLPVENENKTAELSLKLKESEDAARHYREEVEALKREKAEQEAESQKRYKELLGKVNMNQPQTVEIKVVDEKLTAARLSEIEKKYESREKQREEIHEANKRNLLASVAKKEAEIDAAAKMKLDITRLTNEKRLLEEQIDLFETQKMMDKENGKIRGQFRKLGDAGRSIISLAWITKEKISQDKDNCGLSREELEFFLAETRSTLSALYELKVLMDEILGDGTKTTSLKKGGDNIVEIGKARP
jgi:ParB-like chromosome segregation protein Spo0J